MAPSLQNIPSAHAVAMPRRDDDNTSRSHTPTMSKAASRPMVVPKPLSLQNTPNSRVSRGLQSRQSKGASTKGKKVTGPKSFKEHKNFRWIIAGSFVLCFNAGFINNLTLSTVHAMPTAHVTGMVARLSIALSSHKWELLEAYGIAYLCFLLGATMSGMMIQHETFYLGRNYGRAFLFIAVIQAMALLFQYTWTDCMGFVWACALACGIQNALTSKYSGNVVRTTHLTGATTDLGIALGHILKGRKDEGWRVMMHTNSLMGFLTGGIAGYFAFKSMAHNALLINIGLTTFCGMVHTVWVAYHENIRILDVLEATQDIKIHRHRVTTPHHQVERVVTPQHHMMMTPHTPQPLHTPHTPQTPQQHRYGFERPPRPGLRPTLPVYHHHPPPPFTYRTKHNFDHVDAEEKMDNSSQATSLRGYHTPQRSPPVLTPLSVRSNMTMDLHPFTPMSARTGMSFTPAPTMVEPPLRPIMLTPVLVDDVIETVSVCSSLSDYDENEIELPPEEDDEEPEVEEGDIAAEDSDDEYDDVEAMEEATAQ